MTAPTSPLRAWAAAGFGSELLPVCGPKHSCSSPGKIPHLCGWQEMEITPDLVAAWGRSHHGNVGLRTRHFPALDLDIEDQGIADACERVALTTLGSTARRTRANTARRLLLYRVAGEPFAKVVVPFTTPGGASSRVEILGAGQQVVVDGVHHTGAALEWCSGRPTAESLATISEKQRDTLAAAIRRGLAELGCTLEASPAVTRRPSTLPRMTDRDAAIAEEALGYLDPDIPYDQWFRVGMALHSRFPDESGLALWDSWSSRGAKYPGTRALARHWASFHAGKGVGFGTLIALARTVGGSSNGR